MPAENGKSKSNGQAAEQRGYLSAETLSGDVRDKVLDLLRDMPCWTKLSEREQRKRIDAATRIGRDLVRDVVLVVSHREFPHLVVTAGKWTVKDGAIAITLGAIATEDAVRDLIRHPASGVLVLSDASAFFGERRPALPQPDEPELPITDKKPASDGLSPDAAKAAFEANADKAPSPAEVDAAATKRARKRRKAPEHEDAGPGEAEPIGDVASRVVDGTGVENRPFGEVLAENREGEDHIARAVAERTMRVTDTFPDTPEIPAHAAA
jgi:hypothetical protein